MNMPASGEKVREAWRLLNRWGDQKTPGKAPALAGNVSAARPGRGCGWGCVDGGWHQKREGFVNHNGEGAEGDARSKMWVKRGEDPLQDCKGVGEFGEEKGGKRPSALEVVGGGVERKVKRSHHVKVLRP